MTQHIIIKGPLSPTSSTRTKILLPADRQTLAKRRWHGVAADGVDFGFDLETPLPDGAVFFETDASQYVLAQKPEPLLEIDFKGPTQAAHLAWSLGNLHFPIEIAADKVRVVDDPAVRIYLERDHVRHKSVSAVFHPIKTVPHSHAHGHTH
jgi:urease accessory protein